MFTATEFKRIHREFKEVQLKRRLKLQKVWGTLLVITILILVLFIVLFPNQFQNPTTAWILPTYGGMVFLIVLIGFLVSNKFLSEKPFFDDLFPQVYNKINITEGMAFDYKAYDNEDKEFNKMGGLFTRFASVKIKRHVEGKTEEQHRFNIYDCKMTTSNGKNQQTHFDGIYFILEKNVNTSLQVRTNGSPKLKGIKFDKQPEFDEIRVYKETEQTMRSVDNQFVRFVSDLARNPEYKRVYLSIVEGQIHLALWYKNHPARKQKIMTVETLNNLYIFFLNEYKLLSDIDNVDVF